MPPYASCYLVRVTFEDQIVTRWIRENTEILGEIGTLISRWLPCVLKKHFSLVKAH